MKLFVTIKMATRLRRDPKTGKFIRTKLNDESTIAQVTELTQGNVSTGPLPDFQPNALGRKVLERYYLREQPQTLGAPLSVMTPALQLEAEIIEQKTAAGDIIDRDAYNTKIQDDFKQLETMTATEQEQIPRLITALRIQNDTEKANAWQGFIDNLRKRFNKKGQAGGAQRNVVPTGSQPQGDVPGMPHSQANRNEAAPLIDHLTDTNANAAIYQDGVPAQPEPVDERFAQHARPSTNQIVNPDGSIATSGNNLYRRRRPPYVPPQNMGGADEFGPADALTNLLGLGGRDQVVQPQDQGGVVPEGVDAGPAAYGEN